MNSQPPTPSDQEMIESALRYIQHVGANHVMRGEAHPQQWIVDGLERILAQRSEKQDNALDPTSTRRVAEQGQPAIGAPLSATAPNFIAAAEEYVKSHPDCWPSHPDKNDRLKQMIEDAPAGSMSNVRPDAGCPTCGARSSATRPIDPILPDELYSIAENELANYPSAAEYCRKAGHELRLARALSARIGPLQECPACGVEFAVAAKS